MATIERGHRIRATRRRSERESESTTIERKRERGKRERQKTTIRRARSLRRCLEVES